ncbi:ATP-binding protein [Streptomyces sp. NBC_00237]|uniref:AAA family ATPase n=1 Tax=Streptomyces sp. NBC_00237 TaxID=2975687 RepID=UPI0022560689|nr:ATP-binding protein [Streptomyces sp. NBC_00237]MCX5200267.1 ATP-binding protein [Streptomyces sp. NBC_00237]
MLLNFRVANHRSLREEQSLGLSPVYEADRPEGTEWDAVPVAALFGANASGKSNVVDALRFMARMVVSSHRDAEPDGGVDRHPFALEAEASGDPSWFVVDLVLDGVRHTYGFSVDAERVLDEWLYSYPKGRRAKVFHRSEGEISYGDGAARRELDLIKSITAPNVLFLSVAARSEQAVVQPVYRWFQQAVLFRSGGSRRRYGVSPSTLRLLDDPRHSRAVVALLRAADLGIENAGVEWGEADEGLSPDWYRITRPVTGEAPRASTAAKYTSGAAQVWIEQRGRHGPVKLYLRDQSEGTQVLLDYAGPVLSTLEGGGLLVVDEVDASLHPRLTAHLIRLFQNPASNPRGAQLLLTTHDASLLGRSGGEDVLGRDQVWFVEKGEFGETTLFPLSDFKPRQEENRERRYLGGSYGAVPYLTDERFAEAVAAREDGGRGENAEG